MNTSSKNLKVSFYLKKKNSRKGCCPVLGRITIGKDMVQFSCKLEKDTFPQPKLAMATLLDNPKGLCQRA